LIGITYLPYNIQTQTWPFINSVLSKNQFVQYDGSNCLDLAKAQILKEGYKISGYGALGQTFVTYTASSGIDKTALKDGVSYIISALQRGIPVIVGVDYKNGPSPGNTDNTTDHFIVITGMGSDVLGPYFTFTDNGTNDVDKGMSADNKLHYNEALGLLTGWSPIFNVTMYTVTQIRKSK
jgi:hypothetical protein